MILGVTGTRHGLTDPQHHSVCCLLNVWAASTVHHGSCSGVDVQVARAAFMVWPTPHIIAHPGPDGDPWRAQSGVDHEVLPPSTHFARNRQIVVASTRLLACPGQPTEPPPNTRGGTWYTIRYALRLAKPVTIVWPDGHVEERI